MMSLRELVIELRGDIYAALLIYSSLPKFFKTFIYFISNIVDNDLYFNGHIPPWEIPTKTVPSLNMCWNNPSVYPLGCNSFDDAMEFKFYLKQWWIEFRLSINDYFSLKRINGRIVILPEQDNIQLQIGRKLLVGYLQHFNYDDFQFLVEHNFPSLFQTNRDRRRGTGSISFGWPWFLLNNNSSKLQLNQKYNKEKIYNPTITGYSKIRIYEYISGFEFGQLYHAHYPKHYIEFDGIWIDYNICNLVDGQALPKYSDFSILPETPLTIFKPLIVTSDFYSSDSEISEPSGSEHEPSDSD
jgi:hypothetical protein